MKHPFVKKIICFICASMFFALGYAEVYGGSDDIISQIDKRIAVLDSMLFAEGDPALGEPEYMQWRVDCSIDSAYSQSVDAIKAERVKAIKAQTGLQITGQAYYRPFEATAMDDEDEAVSRYVGKVQVEARWYFLQSGLLKRKGKIRELGLKADIERIEHEMSRTMPDLYANRERMRLISDSILASILLHRVDNLVLLEDAYTYLLGNEQISGDNLLKVMDDRAQAEMRLSTMSFSAFAAENFYAKRLDLNSLLVGTVQIDTLAVLAEIENNDLNLLVLDKKAQLIDQRANNITWWSSVRLAPFVRYSHYFRIDRPMSSNVDVGMSFTIPLDGDDAHTRKALRMEKEQLNYQRDAKIKAAKDRVRYIVMETERLNRAIQGEWVRANTLLRYLKARREAYNMRLGEYNRVGALKEYNSYLHCLESIIELQYKRDALLADLQALVPAKSLDEYCSFERVK